MHLCHRYRGYDRSEQRHKRASPRIRCFIRCLIRPGRHYPPRGSYYQHGGLSNHPSNDDIEMKGRRRKKKKKKIYMYQKDTFRPWDDDIEACDSLSRNKWKRVESSSSFGGGVENFEGGKFRSGKRRSKERIRRMAPLHPAWTRVTRQRRVKASIKTSMVHREQAWYSWQAPFYRVEAPFRWVGSRRSNWGVEKCTRLGGRLREGLPPRRGTKEVRRVKERRYSGG